MPIIFILIAVVMAGVAFMTVVLPLSLLMRYRAGTARRRARGWVTSLNLSLTTISCLVLLTAAAISNAWIPAAFHHTAVGFGSGALLGVLGLLLTRWEITPRGLYYTPSRLLILAITITVTARICYGFWRGWHAWQTTDDGSWIAHAGAAGSMGAGAAVLGYYLIYWFGVIRRMHRASRNHGG